MTKIRSAPANGPPAGAPAHAPKVGRHERLTVCRTYGHIPCRRPRLASIGNLALVIGTENAGKQNRPLREWLGTSSPEYLKRHYIPADETLWQMNQYEHFLIERRKLLKGRLQQVFAFDGDT